MILKDLELEYKRHFRRYVAIANCILHNYQDSEDTVNDAMMRAVKHFHRFDGNDLQAWFATIVRNMAINRYRKQKKHNDHVINAEFKFNETPIDPIDLHHIDDELLEALGTLPERWQNILLLVAQDYKYKEIAEKLNIPLGSVPPALKRARRKLKASIKC